MGRGDNRRTLKVRRRRSQAKYKARRNRWRLEQTQLVESEPSKHPLSKPVQGEVLPAPASTSWTRREFLARCGALIGGSYNPGRHYVTRTVARVAIGIDAEVSGAMRVHLFSDDPTVAEWLSTVSRGPGPAPSLARASSRVGSNGARWYYGFEWRGPAGRDYSHEYPVVESFVTFLSEVALARNARF